ncbi:acyltransferase [Parabacteroides distasonis]|nr:acyltransferase [Parabacteroides distasonis]
MQLDHMRKLSLTYKLLRLIGLNYPEEEYGQVSLWDVICKAIKSYRDAFLMKFIFDSWLLSPILHRKVRPWVLKKIGCHVGKDVFIGTGVWIDTGHAELIYIDDHAHVTGRTVLLCHKHELSHYYMGDDYAKLLYTTGEIHLNKGCSTGTDSIIMPGVTIGERAVIGAGSLVTKDIPAWTIAVGRPAKVVKQIPKREEL